MPSPYELEALRVAEQLQEWVDDFGDASSMPAVVLTIVNGTRAIEIGGIHVYDSEDGYDVETTTLFDHCKAEFLKELENHGHWKRWAAMTDEERAAHV